MEYAYLQRMYLRMRSRYIVSGDCHEFTGVKNKQGYGMISYNTIPGKRTTMSAHRFIYWQSNSGIDMKNLVVMHACDNPSCINIEHLKLGTHVDNAQDKWNKGRANYNASGTKGRRVRKLTDEQVKRIRSMQGELKMIANIFSISVSHVSQIKNGKRKQLVY